MSKRVLVVPVVVVVFFVSCHILVGMGTLMSRMNNTSFVPIEKITGIYEEVKLKPGCVVNSGVYFPSDDHGFRHSCGRVAGVLDSSVGLPVTNIRIIDVYGDKCSIIFNCTDDNELYEAENYPLSNLKYEERIVNAANDCIKIDLIGTGYTTKRLPSSSIFMSVLILIATWVIGVTVIRKLLK